jgi:hypothetical protein
MLVVTEADYLIATRLGVEAEARFLGDLAAGNLIAEPVTPSDWLRIAELVVTYRGLPLERTTPRSLPPRSDSVFVRLRRWTAGTSASFGPDMSMPWSFSRSAPAARRSFDPSRGNLTNME